ncbi:hypothetical protein [Rubripirellula lacrimiformis]|uniref:hypothetical protein n=1 Tax=Rubripirellula lacrimiformis TaxID=1930273 RepID=UPI0011A5C453|nr:hypothetical protein [Rubripirellula lacrimiformis]
MILRNRLQVTIGTIRRHTIVGSWAGGFLAFLAIASLVLDSSDIKAQQPEFRPASASPASPDSGAGNQQSGNQQSGNNQSDALGDLAEAELANPKDPNDSDAVLPELTEDQIGELTRLTDDLASGEFARRERAVAALMSFGLGSVEPLRKIAADTSDAEVRLRINQVVRQLTHDDMHTRINDFLAGKDVGFQGWDIFRSMLGDNGAIREIFVELTNDHPDVLASLEGSTRERVVALEKSIVAVQQRIFVQREFPTRGDTFALVLPTLDPKVPITPNYESVLLSTLQKEAASQIRADAQLSPAFKALLGRWMIRSTPTSRIDVLLMGMSWGVEDTLTLGITTLADSDDPETLATAMQAIAKFGIREHVVYVEPLLEDTRAASDEGFADGQRVRAQVCDVAIATIAVLMDVKLSDVGMPGVQKHPTYGFIRGDISFPVDDPLPRQKALSKIRAQFKRPMEMFEVPAQRKAEGS